jgi:hypothetical protein
MSDQTLLSVLLLSIQLVENIRFNFLLLWADPNVSNGEPLEVVASRRALETGPGSSKRDRTLCPIRGHGGCRWAIRCSTN